MKKLFVVLLTFLSFTSVFAGEFTGAGSAVSKVLMRAGFTPESLSSQGLRVVRPSGSVHLDDIRFIVTKRNLVRYNNIDHIDFKIPSSASTLGEVRHFEVMDQRIPQGKVAALIID